MLRSEGYNAVVNFAFSFLELLTIYYVGGCILQFVLPTLVRVRGVQGGKRPKGQIYRDAWRSVGMHRSAPLRLRQSLSQVL